MWTGVNRLVTELPAVNHPGKTTVVGQAVTIPCHSSNSNPVNWWYQLTEDKPVTELVVNGELVNSNAKRFRLSPNYDLTLLSAKWADRGVYTCVEDTAFGTRHITHLIVEGMWTVISTVTVDNISRKHVQFFCWKLRYEDTFTLCLYVTKMYMLTRL